ncbi:snoRNA-binding protein [Chytridiales sp. JEL 0842]|nr:snoRNA-binding protein [Chytridiales sp. JEL 0842]
MAKSSKMDIDSPAKKSTAAAAVEKEEVSYETRCLSLSPIAHPLASKKLTKKVLKTVKKATKAKGVKRGVKEVVKGLKKGSKGVVIIAGDISPLDVLSHLPILCEDHSVPYLYVPSKEDLGLAGCTKRPTSCIMIVDGKGKGDAKAKVDEYKEGLEEVLTEAKQAGEKLITTV